MEPVAYVVVGGLTLFCAWAAYIMVFYEGDNGEPSLIQRSRDRYFMSSEIEPLDALSMVGIPDMEASHTTSAQSIPVHTAQSAVQVAQWLASASSDNVACALGQAMRDDRQLTANAIAHFAGGDRNRVLGIIRDLRSDEPVAQVAVGDDAWVQTEKNKWKLKPEARKFASPLDALNENGDDDE